MTLEMVVSPFRETWALIEKSYRELFIDFAKIYILTFIFGAIAGGAIIAFVLALGIGASMADLLTNPPLIIAIALIGATALIGISIVTSAISTTMYPLVKARAKGKGIDIIKTAIDFIPRMAGYLLVVWGVSILLFIPGVLVFGLSVFFEGLGLLMLLAPLVVLASLAAYLVFAFLIQFAIIEIALNNMGAVEAMKASMAKVKGNWLVVLGFDIAVFLISLAIGIVSSVINQLIGFLSILAIVNVALVALVFIMSLIVMLITTIVTAMVTIPAFYYFWRSLK
jgi:hypothetical protein